MVVALRQYQYIQRSCNWSWLSYDMNTAFLNGNVVTVTLTVCASLYNIVDQNTSGRLKIWIRN